MTTEGNNFNKMSEEEQLDVLTRVWEIDPKLVLQMLTDDLIYGIPDDMIVGSREEETITINNKRLGRYLIRCAVTNTNENTGISQTAEAFHVLRVTDTDVKAYESDLAKNQRNVRIFHDTQVIVQMPQGSSKVTFTQPDENGISEILEVFDEQDQPMDITAIHVKHDDIENAAILVIGTNDNLTIKRKKLAEPTNIKIKRHNTEAYLSWDEVPDAQGYEVQHSTTYDYQPASTTTHKTEKPEITIKNLERGRKYYFRMRAVERLPEPWRKVEAT